MAFILVLNLGSTSSKIAVYQSEKCLYEENLIHDAVILSRPVFEQINERQTSIEQTLENNDFQIKDIDMIACRGGLLKPIKGGTYVVNDMTYDDLLDGKYGKHAANLSGIIGYQIGKAYDIPVYTTDPVVIDELIDEVRLTGIPGIKRKSIFHALNHKAVARRYANKVNKSYHDLNLIVAHLGGGVSIAAHHHGEVIDVNDALYGEGPMALTRSGTIPNDLLLKFTEDNHYSVNDMKDYITRHAGIQAYTQSTDFKSIMSQYEKQKNVTLLIDAFIIQISKAIAERAAVLKGQVDQILLTGGLSYSKPFVNLISEHTEWIAPVTVFAGEYEMVTLAEQALKAYRHEISVSSYC